MYFTNLRNVNNLLLGHNPVAKYRQDIPVANQNPMINGFCVVPVKMVLKVVVEGVHFLHPKEGKIYIGSYTICY